MNGSAEKLASLHSDGTGKRSSAAAVNTQTPIETKNRNDVRQCEICSAWAASLDSLNRRTKALFICRQMTKTAFAATACTSPLMPAFTGPRHRIAQVAPTNDNPVEIARQSTISPAILVQRCRRTARSEPTLLEASFKGT